MKLFSIQKNKGFTLIETLVALSIFIMAVVALVVVTAQGVGDVNYAKNKVVAASLMQEGIELVRNLRDTHSLQDPTGWDTFINNTIDPCLTNADGCFVDPVTLVVSACPGPCPALRRDESDSSFGYYDYSLSGNETTFTRTISAEEMGNQIKITSKVEWRQGTATKVISGSEYMFKWFTLPITP